MSELLCSICLYLPRLGLLAEDDVLPARTVVNGQAVCVNHAGIVSGGKHAQALADVYFPSARTVEP